MKVTELYFHMVLFIMLIMDDSSFHDYEWNFSVTIQMKATELYFHVVMFITLIEKILSFTAVKEIIVCDHSNEAIDQYFRVIFLFIKLYSVFQTFKSVEESLVSVWSSQWKKLQKQFVLQYSHNEVSIPPHIS